MSIEVQELQGHAIGKLADVAENLQSQIEGLEKRIDALSDTGLCAECEKEYEKMKEDKK